VAPRNTFKIPQRGALDIRGDSLLKPVFPNFKIVTRHDLVVRGTGRDVDRRHEWPRLRADQAGKHLRKTLRDFRKVDRLEAVSTRLQRRIADWQNCPEDVHMVFGPDVVDEGREAGPDLPADVFQYCPVSPNSVGFGLSQ